MSSNMNKQTGYDMLYLVSCVLKGRVPESEKISSFNIESLVEMCRYQSLGCICAYALESAGIKNADFEKEKNLAIRKVMMLDAERKQITKYFEENGIWYMPLKGVYMKEFYPKIGMRQMCDNDILVDQTRMNDIDSFMTGRGYKLQSEKVKNDWEYLKEPVYNFEIHRLLFTTYHKKSWESYYADVKSRLINDENSNYGYHFSDEDFYIFMIIHEFKHYSSGGTGLRSLIDTWVYISSHPDLDWKYISEECAKLEIDQYERESRELAEKVFSSDNESGLDILDEKERKMLDYYIFSGTYGTVSNRTEKKVREYTEKTGSKSKFGYIMYRIFPPMETYREYFPFIYNHKILWPVGWIYRLVRGLVRRNDVVKGEINYLKNKNKI